MKPGAFRKTVLRIVGILIAAGLGAGASALLLDFLDHRPATIIKAAFNADTVTYRDGRIQLYFDITRVRECPTTLSSYLWTWVLYNGKRTRLYMPLDDRPHDLNADHYILSLKVPAGVWDGEWHYYTSSTSHCGGLLSLLRNQVSEIPDIPIYIFGTQAHTPPGMEPADPPKNVITGPDPKKNGIILQEKN